MLHTSSDRIWFYWGLDPLAYANKGFAVNEFRASRWQAVFTDTSRTETVGDAVLAQRGLPRTGYNRILGACVLVREHRLWMSHPFLLSFDNILSIWCIIAARAEAAICQE